VGAALAWKFQDFDNVQICLEIVDHLLLYCSMARELRLLVFSLCGVH
jgi:hypothetical protein